MPLQPWMRLLLERADHGWERHRYCQNSTLGVALFRGYLNVGAVET
jgi:hypothetical protein